MRDVEPEEYEVHARIQDAFEEVARLYNFRMMEPAPIEHLSILRAKSGIDVDKEIYAFKDKGGRDVGLRFDLTVGMTRYVCSKRGLKPPVKLACMGGNWRYDEPQRARYRWFKQWDLEIFGPPSVESDAEVVDASARLFEGLGLRNFAVRVGDRTVVQQFVDRLLKGGAPEKGAEMMRALDKVRKRTLPELEKEYAEKGFSGEEIDRLFSFGGIRGQPAKVLDRLRELKLDARGLDALADMLHDRGVRGVEYCMDIVRGIDYYTGIVFEVYDTTHEVLGSLAGGGRYDALPKVFGRQDLSATGSAGGLERLVMALHGKGPGQRPLAFVASAGPESYSEAVKLLTKLRASGVRSDMPTKGRPLSRQMEDASAMGARWVLIVGAAELAAKQVTLRDMKTRSEERQPFDAALKAMLAAQEPSGNL